MRQVWRSLLVFAAIVALFGCATTPEPLPEWKADSDYVASTVAYELYPDFRNDAPARASALVYLDDGQSLSSHPALFSLLAPAVALADAYRLSETQREEFYRAVIANLISVHHEGL